MTGTTFILQLTDLIWSAEEKGEVCRVTFGPVTVEAYPVREPYSEHFRPTLVFIRDGQVALRILFFRDSVEDRALFATLRQIEQIIERKRAEKKRDLPAPPVQQVATPQQALAERVEQLGRRRILMQEIFDMKEPLRRHLKREKLSLQEDGAAAISLGGGDFALKADRGDTVQVEPFEVWAQIALHLLRAGVWDGLPENEMAGDCLARYVGFILGREGEEVNEVITRLLSVKGVLPYRAGSFAAYIRQVRRSFHHGGAVAVWHRLHADLGDMAPSQRWVYDTAKRLGYSQPGGSKAVNYVVTEEGYGQLLELARIRKRDHLTRLVGRCAYCAGPDRAGRGICGQCLKRKQNGACITCGSPLPPPPTRRKTYCSKKCDDLLRKRRQRELRRERAVAPPSQQ